jgi:hypothetical protein
LSAALEFVKAEEAGALVVARFDRLVRDTMQALLIEDEFRRAVRPSSMPKAGTARTTSLCAKSCTRWRRSNVGSSSLG